jgi:hypothetical protein
MGTAAAAGVRHTRRVLTIPRNIDAPPPGGVEFLGAVFGAVPNDGAPHALAQLVGAPGLSLPPDYRIRIARVRAEWQSIDASLPPPLTLLLQLNGQASIAAAVLNRVMLQPIALGSPAVEFPVFVELQPGASVNVLVINTGAVNPQLVGAYVSGWAYPQTLRDGAAYGAH